MPKVNPDILKWARETAGLDLTEASSSVNLTAAYGLSAEDRLARLEAGEDIPTRPLLLRMAKQYRRPLIVFYMTAPPRTGDRGSDFRTLPEEYEEKFNPLLDALIRRIHARQSILREVLEEDEDIQPLKFVGSCTLSTNLNTIANSIAEVIRFDLEQFRRQATTHEAFTWLREKTEAAGIFVLLVGDLGSHHTTIPPEVFRGFTIADPIAPFVVINDRDSRAAWSFTLIHELSHIWLGQTGVSNFSADKDVEIFCNQVAGTVLLPKEELNELDVTGILNIQNLAKAISDFSFTRNLSSSMVAYSLFLSNIIDHATWFRLSRHFGDLWEEAQKINKENRRGKSGGPSYYTVRRHRLGEGLLTQVQRMIADGSLSTTKAAKVLDVKPMNVSKLFAGGILPGVKQG